MDDLEDFIGDWDAQNRAAHRKIALFDTRLTQKWTMSQQELFAKLFYHARGGFHHFMWIMGNKAPNYESKETIVDNFREEFGKHGPSHEQLYLDFANSLSVEVGSADTYWPFLQAYDKGHWDFLKTKDWDTCINAFAAYERLDNIDYQDLEKLVISFGITGKALRFFEVHKNANHFEMVGKDLRKNWELSPYKV